MILQQQDENNPIDEAQTLTNKTALIMKQFVTCNDGKILIIIFIFDVQFRSFFLKNFFSTQRQIHLVWISIKEMVKESTYFSFPV